MAALPYPCDAMGFLDRLLKSTTKPRSTMLSVSVSLRGGRYYIVTIHGSDGGDPCLAAGPVETLGGDATPITLGAAIRRALQRTTHDRAYPANAADWKAVTAPLLTAAGCKTWSAFAKGASDLRVNQTDTRVQVLPSVRDDKGAFAPVADRERHLEAPSDDELGSLVAAELAFALARDG
jgi:hypothetical protein